MSRPANRVETLRLLLNHIRGHLSFDFAFALWDGSTVPADLSPDALAITIADEGVISSIVRRPNVDTLLNLWVTRRFDVRNGTIFDLVARHRGGGTKGKIKSLNKRLVLKTIAQFLFVSRGGPWPLEDIGKSNVPTDGSESANKGHVQYHYDLSNAVYALFLDPEMVYSCGYFTKDMNDLATAQRDKLDMICRKLRLKPGERLLDVGCGWGGLVCHAAQHYGVEAVGVTLSREQFDFANAKIVALGLKDRVRLEFKDYSSVEGTFDKIASIGMFEHVGVANHPAYFQTINRLLRSRGLYLHHAITRRAPRKGYRLRQPPEAVALGRYIFPGAEVDYLGMSTTNLERYGFEVHDTEGWREHYARTTRSWHDRLLSNQSAAEGEIGSVKTRLWIAYLAGCSIAFERGTASIFQTLVSKRARGPSGLPLTRSDLYETAEKVSLI